MSGSVEMDALYVNYDDISSRPSAVPVSELVNLVSQITNSPDILQQQFSVRILSHTLSRALPLYISLLDRINKLHC